MNPLIRRSGTLLALHSALSCAGASAIELHYPSTSGYPDITMSARRARLLEHIALWLERFASAPGLSLSLVDCGEANASYWGQRAEMRLCTEIIQRVAVANESEPDPGRRALRKGGTLLWIAAHEFGHALIHRRQWPVLGREEDAADQIATLIVLRSSLAVPSIYGAISFFNQRLDGGDPGDVHSLDPVRRINIACIAFGVDPAAFGELAGLLPPKRRAQCAAEAAHLVRSVQSAGRTK